MLLSGLMTLAGYGALGVFASPGVSAASEPLPAASAPAPIRREALRGQQVLHLDIHIDGQPANLVAKILQGPDGRLSATRAELRAIGVKPPGEGKDDEPVALDAVPGLGQRYDAAAQRLHLTVAPDTRLAREYVAEPPTGALANRPVERSRDFGAVLNYNAYATAGQGYTSGGSSYRTGSVTLDGRIFSPLGVIQGSAIAGSTLGKEGLLRLDTSVVYADPDRLMTGTIGDAVSGGTSWSRPIRFGGAQLARRFSLRPDLVTAPLPSVSGSAAVPSTVDVFVDNVRVATQQVGSGPFRITNLPVPGESGTARVVVRDVTGRETVTSLPFFTSAKLLSPGQFDFSLDAGFPRLNYALESFDYSRRFAGIGTARYGLTPWLTLETHAEATAGVAAGGLGAVIGAGKFGLFSLAAAASRSRGETGALLHAGWSKSFGPLFLGLSTQRTYGRYRDVAAVTAEATQRFSTNLTDSGFFQLRRSAEMPRAIDRLSFGYSIPDWKASIAVSLVNIDRGGADRSHLASLTYSQTFLEKYHFYVSGYADLANKRDAGIIAGLSFALGDTIQATTSAAFSRDGKSAGLELARPMGPKVGDYGWRVYDSEGSVTQRGATAGYRSPWARLEAGVRQDRSTVSGHGEIEGSLVATPDGVFAANRIHDAFAIVDGGAPGVEILHENRPVGKTGRDGKLLVPNLTSFGKSRIAIDPDSLPRDRLASLTETDVMPGYLGSATVKVKSLSVKETARVELRDAKGAAFPAGTRVEHAESGKSFTLGHGSIVYLPEIDDINTLSVQQGLSSCTARFTKSDRKGPVGKVGPLTCGGAG